MKNKSKELGKAVEMDSLKEIPVECRVVIVPAELVEEVLNYLAGNPFRDVHTHMSKLMSLRIQDRRSLTEKNKNDS